VTDAPIPQKQPEQAPPAPPAAPYKVCVWFTSIKGEAVKNERVVLSGIYDILAEQDIVNVENFLKTNGGFDTVMIQNWRRLAA
jgi:hypothetical protein